MSATRNQKNIFLYPFSMSHREQARNLRLQCFWSGASAIRGPGWQIRGFLGRGSPYLYNKISEYKRQKWIEQEGQNGFVGTRRSTPAANPGKNQEKTLSANQEVQLCCAWMGDQSGVGATGTNFRFDLQLDAILPLFDEPLQKRICYSIQIIEKAFLRYG